MKKLIIPILFSLSSSAIAAQSGHIRNEVYHPNKVYQIYYKTGKAMLIELDKEERPNDPGQENALGFGDQAAWSVGVKGNNIVLKPTDKNPSTNIVLATNKRTYAFELLPATRKNPTTYVIRFTYPDQEKKARLAEEKLETKNKNRQEVVQRKIKEITKQTRPVFNTEYYWFGEIDALKPTAAWDNGRFTYFEYDHAGDLPNFYKVLSDGTEALINSSIDENGVVILHDVMPKLRVRLGLSVIEILNNKYSAPQYNTTGTGDYDSVRIYPGEQNEWN